jgi:5-methylcytosine-specific restriction enzyme A
MIKRLCCYAGCSNFRLDGSLYCDKHQQYGRQKEAERMARLGSLKRANEGMYDTTAWRTLRREVINEHPYCCMCGTAGSKDNPLTVDHMQAPRGNEELFFDKNNLQILCRCCHNKKTFDEIAERKRIK